MTAMYIEKQDCATGKVQTLFLLQYLLVCKAVDKRVGCACFTDSGMWINKLDNCFCAYKFETLWIFCQTVY